MSTRRFKLDGEVYEMASHADVTLRDFILLEQETIDLGRRFTMGEIVKLGEKFAELTPTEAKHDPDGAWMMAATIWMAMIRKKRQGGDNTQVLFADAIDANLATFEELPDPQDKQPPGKPKKKAAKKRPSGSGHPGRSARVAQSSKV